MSTVQEPPLTIADLLDRLGDVRPSRVRMQPLPGSATADDVVAIHSREKRLYEVVDGILVEKAMGFSESMLAVEIARILKNFVTPRNLGLVVGEAGMMRLIGGSVRIPDVSFIAWSRLPGGRVPREPVPLLSPNLAVEVLSEGNTPGEMERKLSDYFESGVELVWIIDPVSRTAEAHSGPGKMTPLTSDQSLDGGSVLPGFTLLLRDLFAELDRHGPAN